MKYVSQIRGKWTVRVTVPEKLRGLIGKRELVATDLSSKPRERESQAHKIINEFLGQIEQARAKLTLMENSQEVLHADVAKRRYAEMIEADSSKRENMPTQAEIEAEIARIYDVIDRQEAPQGDRHWNLYTNLEILGSAREAYANGRTGRLKALKEAIKSGETRWVDETVEAEIRRLGLAIVKGSKEWHKLAVVIMRAEIEALERTIERDRGDFGGTARDPLLIAPDPSLLGHTGKVAPGRGITLSEALSAFHSERSAGGSALHPRTAEEHRNAVRMFNEFMGREDLPIQSITKKDVIT